MVREKEEEAHGESSARKMRAVLPVNNTRCGGVVSQYLVQEEI